MTKRRDPCTLLVMLALVTAAGGCLEPSVSILPSDGPGEAGGASPGNTASNREVELRVTNDTGRLLYRYSKRCTLGEGWIEIVDRGYPPSALTTPVCGSNEIADCFSPPFDVVAWEPGETLSYTWEGGGWFEAGGCWEFLNAPLGEQVARVCVGESYGVDNLEPPMEYVEPADCAGEPGWCHLQQQHCLDIEFALSGDQGTTIEASLPEDWLP